MSTAPSPATIRDVARLAGVSPATVSNVLRDHPRVSDATRARVRAAADELGYEPNALARSLRSGRSGTIALVVPDLRNAYFAELASEVIGAASRYGLRVAVEVLAGDRAHEVSVLTGSMTAFVDGLVYVPQKLLGTEIDDVLETRRAHRVPVVLLGERGADSHCPQVGYRNVEASRAVTELLLAGGARRIAAIGPHERAGSATPRLEGYLAALDAAGIPRDDALIRPTTAWHRTSGAQAVAELLADGVEVDAVFGFNDMLALGALSTLVRAGLDVPGQVQVAGFDDLEESAFALPALSTVEPGKRHAAGLALEVLAHLLEHDDEDDPGAVDSRLADFTVIPRGTTRSAR
ncbi:LacI family transcriptional regulator [Miniimonas arenae]|uniref:LacI family transcriptional regulator n=1 Tax=Miniimonas arenae TaxID=676201 RepID=A0A5C5BF87_9MICO|nr:LacI family DNA-binding transcriptional regulator [Miniimonas arenae]TNU76414.1 LacI family transcriptional regulator [Miniimonas arenae]